MQGAELDAGSSLGHGASAGSVREETLIVLDWDDTILPTSWLQRINALCEKPLRPDAQQQISALCAACATTLTLAHSLGTVIIITNSAPGWVDQSCQLFMPSMYQPVMRLPIVAKPMNAPLTFKIGAFRRECRKYANLVSIGDGDAERAASLRLGVSMGVEEVPSRVKSLKLLDLPTCQQLIAQHETLQQRLADVTAFQGHLDLKVSCRAASCNLVHFAWSPMCSQARQGGGPQGVGGSAQSRAQSGPAGHRAQCPVEADAGTRASQAAAAALRGSPKAGAGGQLPPLPALRGAPLPSGQGPAALQVLPGTSGGTTPQSPGVVGNAEDESAAARQEAARSGAGSLWKVQSSGARSPYSVANKKRLGGFNSGFAGQNVVGSGWREHSAPAGIRNN